MTTKTRTDVHRPAELVTENYESIGCYYLGGSDPDQEPGYWYVDLDAKLGFIGVYGEDFDRCDHCGARIAYGAVLRYKDEGYIKVGETCLGNRFELATNEFQKLRKAAQLDRERQRTKLAWEAYKAEHPYLAADEQGVVFTWNDAYESTNGFVQDVLRKGRQYGDISERQHAAIGRALGRDAERAAKAAEGVVEEVKTAPVTGKGIAVEGIVLKVAEKPGYAYNSVVTKLTIKVTTDQGYYLLYGTAPADLLYSDHKDPETGEYLANETVEKGDKVSFVANVQLATWSDDPAFAEFKRPRKALIVEKGK